MASSIRRYTPAFITQLSNSITTELSPEIVENLLEIKINNKFIRRRTPIKLEYCLTTHIGPGAQKGCASTSDTWRGDMNSEADTGSSAKVKFTDRVNGELNKLSESNFSTIESVLHDYIQSTDQYMDIVIDVLFEKSISQHIFSHLYAKMTRMFLSVYGEVFKTKLIEKVELFYEDNISTIFSATATYDELCDMNMKKKKVLGIFIFIGGLYNCQIIDSSMIVKYYQILTNFVDSETSKDNNEKYVDCLCTLVANIGHRLEAELGTKQFKKAFMDQLQVYGKDRKKLSTKSRFKLMDLFDLQKNQWKM